MLARRLGYEQFLDAAFFFHPLISDDNGRKLSKSAGDLSITALRRKKMSPEKLFDLIGGTIDARPRLKSWHLLAEYVLMGLDF